MNDFYVYLYMRERNTKHGLHGTPYYVGKGRGNRAYQRRHRVVTPANPENIVFVAKNMTENDAHQLEMLLIAVHGRLDIGTGCLANLTDGGEGQYGKVKSPEERKRISERMKGKKYGLGWKASPEQKAKLSAALKGIKRPPRTPEHLSKISRLGSKQSPETIEKRFAHRRGVARPPFSEEWRRNISEGKKRQFMSSPIIRDERGRFPKRER